MISESFSILNILLCFRICFIFKTHELKSEQLRNLLAVTRHVTICLDSWTKRGLTASFLGISACFFDKLSEKPVHAFLSLMEIKHPHTGEKLAGCLDECLRKWGISSEKVLLVVTDNGTNMIKAVKLLQSQYSQPSDEISDEEEESDYLNKIKIVDSICIFFV